MRRCWWLALAIAGCGLDVTGPPGLDASAASTNAGKLEDGGGASAVVADAGATCTADISNDMQHCGACFAACPAGTDECAAGTCVARMSVIVHIDGESQLHIKGASMKWHHTEYDAPGRHPGPDPTTINGVAWLPTWPAEGSNVDCNCDSSSTTVEPALPDRAQTVTLKQTNGRRPVTLVQPSAANGNELTVLFADTGGSTAGADWYEVLVTYASR